MLKQLFLSFLAIIVAVVLALTLFFSHYSNNILREDLLTAYQKSSESIENQCNDYVVSIQRMLLEKSISESIQAELRNFSPDTVQDFPTLNEAGRVFNCRVFPIYDDKVYCESQGGSYVVYPQAYMSWVQKTIARNGRLCLTAIEQDGIQYIRFAMMVTDIQNWETPLAILATDIQLDGFVVSIGKNALGSSDYLILVDEEQNILYPYQDIAQLHEKVQASLKDGSFIDESSVCWSIPIARSSWHLVLSYSTSNIQTRTCALYRIAAVISIVAIAVAFVLTLLLSYWHAGPITVLSKHMNTQSLDKIEIPASLNSDYSTLYTSYNEMVEQLTHLLDQLYQTSKKEQETQLKMLQAQLNPHFIYNVLDSINWLAMKYQAKDIQMMVSELACMLRCSLNSGRDIITVEREIQQIRSYLKIQSYRYNNSIRVIYDISPEILSKKMIKLLLQPLVENALNHGLETYEGEKILKITGRLDGYLLVFEVLNNGHAPDLNRIQQVLSGTQQVTTSYGIRNVNERIKTTYGEHYGLEYRIEQGWIVANITIPCTPL